jgi:hypothetical protein
MKKMSWLIIIILSIQCSTMAVVEDPGSRGVDWDAVKAKIQNHPWAKNLVEDLKNSVRNTQRNFDHPPLGTTGWLHEYYCDKDAGRLRFDPKKPTEHVCPKCNTVYTGSPYDDCWRSSVHSSFASAASTAAVLFRITDEKPYLDFAKNTLLWYADNFDKFSPHGNHAGKGIIREQSLDEATQLVRLATAYWDICPFLTPTEREHIASRFLIPDAQFIHQQTGTIHNIHSWHNAAVGLVGFALGDKDLIHQAIDGKHGLIEQIKQGISEDGFWYEGSISYHFYTISSMQDLYTAAKAQKYPLPGTGKFQLMYTAPLDFAFPNHQLPANNDCWYDQFINERTDYYEVASHLFPVPRIKQELANFYQTRKRTGENALLFGLATLPTPNITPQTSVHFEHSGVAILRNPAVNLLMKYGPYGGGHDHRDRLNLLFFANNTLIMPDLGTSGYGISLNKWFRAPAAHNMVIVDEKMQDRKGGYLIKYTPDTLAAGAKEVYPGVDIQREVKLLPNGFTDHVNITSDKTHTYDLVYHIRGTLQTQGLSLKNFTGLPKSGGYEFIKQPLISPNNQNTKLVWKLRDVNATLTMHGEGNENFDLITGLCPDNPADKDMSIILLRAKSKNAGWAIRVEVSQ